MGAAETEGRRLCATCGHSGIRGTAPDPAAESIATWPVALDSDDVVYQRGDVSTCSACGSVAITYTPAPKATDDDRRWSALLQPEVLAGLAKAIAGARETDHATYDDVVLRDHSLAALGMNHDPTTDPTTDPPVGPTVTDPTTGERSEFDPFDVDHEADASDEAEQAHAAGWSG